MKTYSFYILLIANEDSNFLIELQPRFQMSDVVNSTNRKLRACLNCSIILSTQEFKESGCPNCPFLNVNKDKNIVYATSPSFKGTIALFNPKQSWVARWQRISNYKPGMYAMVVDGVLSDKLIEDVEREGRVYINRSNSFELD